MRVFDDARKRPIASGQTTPITRLLRFKCIDHIIYHYLAHITNTWQAFYENCIVAVYALYFINTPSSHIRQ